MANEKINTLLIEVDTISELWKGLSNVQATNLNESDYQKLEDPSIPYRSIVFIRDTGEIWTHGRYYGSGLNSYELSYNPSKQAGINLDSNWTSLDGFDLNTLASGSYLIQIIHRNCCYTGFMSYIESNTCEEEIILHRAGCINEANKEPDIRLFLKLSGATLQMASNTKEDNVEFSLKIKRLL